MIIIIALPPDRSSENTSITFSPFVLIREKSYCASIKMGIDG
jgi:hypothetical protein